MRRDVLYKRYINGYDDSASNITYSDIDFFYLLTRFHPAWKPKIRQLTRSGSEGNYFSNEIRWLSEFKGKHWQPTLSDMPFLKSSVYSNLPYYNNTLEVVARYHKYWQPSPELLDTTLAIKLDSHYFNQRGRSTRL